MIRILKRLAFCVSGVLLATGLASCTVGPDYQRPAVTVPPKFKSATTQEAVSPQLARDWWKLFNDPQLSALEDAAIRANPGVQSAAARVLQARAASRVVESQFYPLVTAGPSISRSRASGARSTSSSGTVVTGGNGASGNGTSNSGGSRRLEATSVQIPFDLSYEVDIWGRVRRLSEASQSTLKASTADFEVVLQTLEADVAQDYFNIRSLDAQEKILQLNVASYEKQINLTQKQLNAGLVGRIDLMQAQTLLNSTTAQQIDIRRQRADTEHALAILLGLAPSEFTLAAKGVDLVPPKVPAGLPSELLRRRPDVAEAEYNLIASNAHIGVAVAAFYPTLRLTGAAGFESVDIKHALDWSSHFWSIGPSVSIPIFNGGQLDANLEQTKGRFSELVGNYRTSLLGAYRDVEDALTDLHLRADAADAQNRAVDSAREYLRLSQVQYERGLTNYLLVIDAERTLLQNELSATQLLNQRMISTVLLIKALGGGWNPNVPPVLPPMTLPVQ